MVADRWEHLPHDADIGVRGYGASREAAFEQAALAMIAIMADPTTVMPRITVDIACEAPDDELLLVDWLNALIYEMDTRGLLFGSFKVHIAGNRLHGQASGEPIDPHRHRLGVDVKGATFTALALRRQPDGTWLAQCIVDV